MRLNLLSDLNVLETKPSLLLMEQDLENRKLLVPLRELLIILLIIVFSFIQGFFKLDWYTTMRFLAGVTRVFCINQLSVHLTKRTLCQAVPYIPT